MKPSRSFNPFAVNSLSAEKSPMKPIHGQSTYRREKIPRIQAWRPINISSHIINSSLKRLIPMLYLKRKTKAFLRLQRLKMKNLLKASDWWTGVQVGRQWWVSSSCHTHPDHSPVSWCEGS
jgi:hypothetical protein